MVGALTWHTAGTGIFALALVLVGGVGIGGILTSRAERRHQSAEAALARNHAVELARADRVYNKRYEAYLNAARMLERLRTNASRRYPIIQFGSDPDPNVPTTDEDWELFVSPLMVVASDGVRAAIDAVYKAGGEFTGATMAYEAMKDEPGERSKVRREMEAARANLSSSIDHAARVMRDELSSI